MLSQRGMVIESLSIPDHGVYILRGPPVPAEPSEKSDERRGGEEWQSPGVLDDDHGEW